MDSADDLPGTVYVVRKVGTDLYKIGCTWDAWARMRSLRNAAGTIELLAVLPGGYALEGRLLRHFARLVEPSLGREWLRDDGSVAAFVASLPAANRGSVVVTAPMPRATGRRNRQIPDRENHLFDEPQAVAGLADLLLARAA